MKTVGSLKEMQEVSAEWHRAGHTIALVPTMGFLHEGHLSLIRLARTKCDILVVSIFVNPSQFGPNEDLADYPQAIERDTSLCSKEGVDVLFCPLASDIYAEDHSTWVEEIDLSGGLCGASRPTHFRGVTTVVAKLFNIVRPGIAVFGEKDAQQLRVIKRMTRDLNFPVEIVAGPTVREPDGVAMSSRNENLSDAHRRDARAISAALQLAAHLFRSGCRDANSMKAQMRQLIADTPSIEIDYIEVVDCTDLKPVITLDRPIIVALAAKIGSSRLIDNRVLSPED
jgi:pantoate--beta-alanine ligase